MIASDQRSSRLGLVLLAPLSLWLATTFAVPMGTVGLLSLQADTSIFAPLSLDLTVRHLAAVLTDPYYLEILAQTLWIGAQVTLWSALLGVPIALWLSRVPPKWRSMAVAIVLIPLLTNVVVRSLGLLQALAPDAPLPALLALLTGQDRVNLLFTDFAVIVALVQVFCPFLIMAVYDGLTGIDRRVDEAAESLGAPPIARFWTVTLPLALPGLRAGATIVFLLATTAYVSATLLGGKQVWVAGMVVYEEALQILNYPGASAVAVVLMLCCVVATVLINRGFGLFLPWLVNRPRMLPRAEPLPDSAAQALEFLGPWVGRALFLAGLALLTFPLLLVVINSVNDVPQATAGTWQGFTTRWYAMVLLEGSAYIDSAVISARLAVTAAVIALALSVPAAFALVRHSPADPDLLASVYMLPLALPGIAFALGILKLLQIFVAIPPFWGLVMVHVVLISPFTLAMLRTAVLNLDPAQEEAAQGLGAGPIRTFVFVTLPGLAPGLTAAGIIAFLISFGEVTVTAFLTTARLQTLPVRIYADIQFDVLPTVNVVSTLLILATIAVLALVNRLVPLERVWHR